VSLSRLWAFLAVALPTLSSLVVGLPSVDLAYQLRAGAAILDNRAIPAVDTWTFTAAGAPWTDQQWGAQVLLSTIFQVGGWTGLVLFRGLLMAVTFGCLFAIGRRAGLGSRLAALLTLVAFAVSAVALALRPQLLAVAIFAIVLLLVADRRSHPRRLWAVPILVLVWANVHGSFFFGPLVLGLAWLEDLHDRVDRPHRTLLVGLVAAVAACVTPFGPAVWGYAVELSRNPEVTRRISEWQPTSVGSGYGALFYMSGLGAALLLARRGRVAPWPTLLWLGVFFAIGAYTERGLAWWAMAAVVPVAAVLASPSEGRATRPEPAGTSGMRRINLVVVGLLVAVGVAVLPPWRPVDAGLAAPQGVVTRAPSGITAALRGLAQPGDRVLNPQVWGSWFEFAVPDVQVATDSRVELIPVAVWNAVDVIEAGGVEWDRQLTDWGVTIAVVEAADTGLAERLAAAGWTRVHADADGSIFVANRP
jgi:hypothetical protein